MEILHNERMFLTYFLQLFDKFKTGNFIIDSIISSLLIGFITYFSQLYIHNFSWDNINIYKFLNNYFYSKKIITIEGRRLLSSTNFWSSLEPNYSDNFKALWNYIVENVDNNNEILNMREILCNYRNYDFEKQSETLFVVDQQKSFPIDKKNNIFAKCSIDIDQNNDEKNSTKYEVIRLEIFSSKKSTLYLKNFIEEIKDNYLKKIREQRKNTQYIYTLIKNKFEESKNELWSECSFKSTRNFNNMFFDEKKNILKKINFFINNKQWYIDKGIPYSLGIGLHGPPGTGKTSFIKSLANMFPERHLIVLSFKLIKTKEQLDDFFFESKYNSNNKEEIDFSKKIIIFEDIDCETSILLKRNNKEKTTNHQENLLRELLNSDSSSEMKTSNSIQNNSSSKSNFQTSEKLTLDDILNLWDGIKETTGRIMIISSNYYEKLDPALIRPGRIDITLKLDLASHNVINDMYYNFYKKHIPKTKLNKIKEHFFSPAQLTNFFYYSENNNEFINKLIENSK